MEITRSAKKSAARAEKLAKIAKGVSTGIKKDKAVKAIGKKYYKKVRMRGVYVAHAVVCSWLPVQGVRRANLVHK